MTYQRPTAPSGIDGIVADGFSLFRASIRSLYLPVFVFSLISLAIFPHQQIAKPDFDFGPEFWLRTLASLVTYAYMYGVITAIAHYIASGSPSGVRSPLSIATSRLPVLLAVNFLAGDAICLGTLLLIIPGVFLVVALYFSTLLPITEGKGPIDSLKGSFDLVDGFWWRTFAIIMIIVAITVPISFVSEFIGPHLAERLEGERMATVVPSLTYAAFAAIIHPLILCLTYGMYQDLRLIKTPLHDARTTD